MPQIRLNNVRASYVYFYKRRKKKDGGEGKYEITLILDDKDNAEDIKKVQALIESLKTHEKFQGKKPTKLGLRRGDDTEDRAADPALGPNKWTIGCRSDNKPHIKAVQPGLGLVDLPEDSGKPYSGCYVDALIDMFPFVNDSDGTTTRGISAEILAVVFKKDGDPLTSRAPVDLEKAFADLTAGDSL